MTSPLHKSMAAAFSEIDAATKSAENPHFRSKYADISAVIAAIKPALIKHDLFFTQLPEPSDRGVTITTMLHHAGGESMALGTLFVPANKNDAQGFGSALTYARRYALVTAFGVPTEDDDGNAAAKGQSQNGAVSPPPQTEYAFPPGPASGITELKKMARQLWREVEGCGDDGELTPLLTLPENTKLIAQLDALENPEHRKVWEGDGADNPGLAGLINRKRTEFAQQIADYLTQ